MTDLHDANVTHRANTHPDEATDTELADEFAGRSLDDEVLGMAFAGRCRRCSAKNRRRRGAGVEETRERIRDGEHVHFTATYSSGTATTHAPPGYWRIPRVICADHPVLPPDKVAGDRWHQARGYATLNRDGERYTLDEVTIEDRSRAGEGRAKSVVVERQQQYLDNPTEGVIMNHPGIPIDDPEPSWPSEEVRWLAELVAEHGPLENRVGQHGGGR